VEVSITPLTETFKEASEVAEDVLLSLEPKTLWKYFNEIRKIPRCSKQEEKAAQYVYDTAKKLGYEAVMDHVKNVVVKVPASPGYEDHPPVCLQAHVDMVCEKNSDVEHDFTKDPIQVRIDGEYVKAVGTTLGADNGIGVASLLALLEEEKSFLHPPLELLFTVDEETGMTGAFELKGDFLKARRLINVDSEEEGTIYIGCAGGGDTEIYLPYKKVPAFGKGLSVKVHGLKGGHSGVDIHLGRANAIKLLARALYRLSQEQKVGLSCIFGGNKRNAIPREAEALITVENSEKAMEVLKQCEEEFRIEYEGKEDTVLIEVKDAEVKEVMDVGEKVIWLLMALPHGVLAMNAYIEGLVDTSTNLAVISTTMERVEIFQNSRSSIVSALEDTRRVVEASGRLAGAVVEQKGSYPSWRPNVKSPLLAIAKNSYKEMFGVEPKVMAIHAGLETAVIGSKFPGMDMISVGPTVNFPHSPDERVHIGSVEKFYRYLKELLQKL